MARLAKPNSSKPWKAEIKVKYKARFLGYFATKDEAERIEQEKRLVLTGSPKHVPTFVTRSNYAKNPISQMRPRDPETGRFVKGELDVAS